MKSSISACIARIRLINAACRRFRRAVL